LCYIQNDQMSLYGLKNGHVETICAAGSTSSGRQAFQKVLVGLEKTIAGGEWAEQSGKLRFPEFQSKKKEQLIFVGDFLQAGEEWLNLVRSLASPHREVVIFQILGDQEADFNLNGFYNFRDLETGREMELDANSVKDQFRNAMDSYLQGLKTDLQIPYVRFVQARLSDPIGMVLKAFLTKRKG
jgi:hypothetical protein